MTARVDVQLACAALAGVPGERAIERWARAALAAVEGRAELTVRVVDEPEGATLNARYRGRDGATNVLSFPFESPPGLDLPLLGDVVICAPVVAREAHAQGKPPEAHWAHMVVHGALHLSGHDHQRDDEAARMEALERDILAWLGFPDPYDADVTAGRNAPVGAPP